jgi:capsular polysaccharide transport system permease protein
MNSYIEKSVPYRLMLAIWYRVPLFIRASRALTAALVAILLATVYWSLLASDRFVSEAHVVVDRTDVSSAPTMDFSSMLGLGSSNRDLLLMRDHLLSVDMALKLDKQLGLRAHYSDWRRDPLSRMWFADGAQEWFYKHYLSRVSVEMDDVVGVLRIRVQAYDPAVAQAISSRLVREGELFMNDLVHGLAREQVRFLEEEVARMGERMIATRNALLAYQDNKGMVSPQSTVEGLAQIVNQLEGDLSRLRTQRGALLGYLSPDAPDVVQLDVQIRSMSRQLDVEKARLASPQGSALNSVAEEYQRLQMEAEFAQDTYRTALVALEKGRVDATRTMKKVSIVQAPTLPEDAQEPRRLYNILVFALMAALIAGIVRLMAAIIRDHQD